MKRLIKYIILFVFVCVGNVTWAEEGERESSFFPDSSYVLRGPKADFLEKYRKDAAFDYTTNIEDSPSIWDWIKRWILERLFRIKVSEGSMQTMDCQQAIELCYINRRDRVDDFMKATLHL